MVRLGMILVLVLATARASSAAVGESVCAIIIGNNAAPNGPDVEDLPTLRYADDDAVRYYHFLEPISRGVVLLSVLDRETQRRYPTVANTAEPPTLENLKHAVAKIDEQIGRDRAVGKKPVLFVVFSGHGGRMPDGSGFLAMLDGRLTRERFYRDLLANIPTYLTHLVIDACYAGALVGTRGVFGDPNKETDAKSVSIALQQAKRLIDDDVLARLPNVGVLAAAGSSQQAHEWEPIQAGVFTHELLSGLRGAADVNGDGEITYSEIHAFVDAANRDVRNSRARLHLVARPPARGLSDPIVDLSWFKQRRTLQGNYSRLKRFHLERGNGERFLDAHLSCWKGLRFQPIATVRQLIQCFPQQPYLASPFE